jgi:hypothetical protein
MIEQHYQPPSQLAVNKTIAMPQNLLLIDYKGQIVALFT